MYFIIIIIIIIIIPRGSISNNYMYSSTREHF